MNITKMTSTGRATNAAISPDGRYVVHVMDENGKQSLWTRQVKIASASQKIIEPQDVFYWGLDPTSPFYNLAHLGVARAAMLTGDTATARTEYQNFFAAWKDADQDLPILVDAKKEYDQIK